MYVYRSICNMQDESDAEKSGTAFELRIKFITCNQIHMTLANNPYVAIIFHSATVLSDDM